MGEAPANETPYELVRRLKSEGLALDAIKAHLTQRGLDVTDIALLLEQPITAAVEQTTPVVSGDTPWALLQKRLAEGFPPEAIEAELKARGHSAEDIRALMIDVPRRAGTSASGDAPSGGVNAPVQLIFGGLLLLAGVMIILSGRISILSIGLIISGVTRLATAFNTERGVSEQRAVARQAMKELAAEDERSRCALHPTLASIGTCPRCGSFACGKCAPAAGFASGAVCMRCQSLPEVIRAREKKAARQAALFLLAAPVMLAIILSLDAFADAQAPSALTIVVLIVGLSIPWVVLAGLQAFFHRVWPSALSLGPWLLLGGTMLVLTDGGAILQFGMWLIPLGLALAGWYGINQARRAQPALISE